MRGIAWMVAAALAAGAAPGALAAQEVGLAIGTQVSPVVVEDLDGNPVDLARFVGGKPVVLEFWATWCGVCAALDPAMKEAERRFGSEADFVTVAVGVNQTTRSIRRHLEDHTVPGLMVFDREGRATRAFEAPATSYVVILDREGRVAYTGIGEEQDVVGAVARVVTGT